MDLQSKGKKAIDTGGATSGSVLAIALVLTRQGAEVTIPVRNSKKLSEAVCTLPGSGSAREIEVDLATAEGAARLIAELPETDILVNNLGIYEPKTFAAVTDEEWLHLFEVNVLSRIRLSRHDFPQSTDEGYGARHLHLQRVRHDVPRRDGALRHDQDDAACHLSRHGGADEGRSEYRTCRFNALGGHYGLYTRSGIHSARDSLKDRANFFERYRSSSL
jgi:NAD(P)-dependent dehydrogenase (short-subunit alcohol dehydrogenase family)